MKTYKIDNETTVYQDEHGHWTGDLYDGLVTGESLLESEVIDMMERRNREMLRQVFPMHGFHS